MIEFFQRLYHFDELIRWGGHFGLIAIVFCPTVIEIWKEKRAKTKIG